MCTASHERETLCARLKGKRGLRVFEKTVLRRMFLIKWKEITGELGRLRNAELQHFVT